MSQILLNTVVTSLVQSGTGTLLITSGFMAATYVEINKLRHKENLYKLQVEGTLKQNELFAKNALPGQQPKLLPIPPQPEDRFILDSFSIGLPGEKKGFFFMI